MNWQTINPLSIDKIPECPGCYVFFAGKYPIYIGSSINLRKRIRRYQIRKQLPYLRQENDIETPWGILSNLKLKISLSKKYGDWLMRELRLIRKLRPIENRKFKPKE